LAASALFGVNSKCVSFGTFFFSADVLSVSIFVGGVLLIGAGCICVYRRRRLAEFAPVEVEHAFSEAERVVADARRAAELHDLELACFRPEPMNTTSTSDTWQLSTSSEQALSEKVQQKKMITFSSIAQKIGLVDGSLRVEDTSISFGTTTVTSQ
jgi:hypothetical protein